MGCPDGNVQCTVNVWRYTCRTSLQLSLIIDGVFPFRVVYASKQMPIYSVRFSSLISIWSMPCAITALGQVLPMQTKIDSDLIWTASTMPFRIGYTTAMSKSRLECVVSYTQRSKSRYSRFVRVSSKAKGSIQSELGGMGWRVHFPAETLSWRESSRSMKG